MSEVKRVYKGEQEVDHDLYKLEVAQTRKNVSYIQNQPIWEPVDHCHFFHSYDSFGKKQWHASPISGHTHEVIERIDENGNLVAECGPAIRVVNGKKLTYENDQHTHEVNYLRSEKIKVRKVNAEHVKFLSAKEQMLKPSGQANVEPHNHQTVL